MSNENVVGGWFDRGRVLSEVNLIEYGRGRLMQSEAGVVEGGCCSRMVVSK